MSANENSTNSNDTETDANSRAPRPQKKYKNDAEVALLALSGQPRILDLDDVWKEDVSSINFKDFRLEDLLATIIYYTHGVEGIRQLQTQRLQTEENFFYDISVREIPDKEDRTMKKIEVMRVRDIIAIWVTEKPTNPQSGASPCEMWIGLKILADGRWQADNCEAGWTIRSSSKPEHLEVVSMFVIMSLMNMIVSIRRKDGGQFKENYTAVLA